MDSRSVATPFGDRWPAIFRTAIGCPGRAFILPAIADDTLAATIGMHDANMKRAAALFGKRDQIAARAPDRCAILAAAIRDAVHVRTVRVHHIYLLASAAIGFERDLLAVG